MGTYYDQPDKKDYLPRQIEIPDALADVPDTIYNEILACVDCQNNYKIQKAEINN